MGTNALARKDRRQQVFFINGRYIKSRIISAALSEAYQNVMMVGKFPVAVISLGLSGNFVDVNVHPTKTEVRFSDDKKIYNAVFWAVKNALSAKKYVPEIDLAKKKEYEEVLKVRHDIAKEKNSGVQVDINLLKDTYIQSLAPQKTEDKKEDKKEDSKPEIKSETKPSVADELRQHIEKHSFFTREDLSGFKQPLSFGKEESYVASDVPLAESKKTSKESFIEETPQNEPSSSEALPKAEENPGPNIADDIFEEIPQKTAPVLKANIDFAVVGQIFDTYIIVQKENEMLIIDQHAAHERLYFEELVEEYRRKDIKKQLLMVGVTLDFDPVKFAIAADNFETRSSLGFECEEFGANSIIVRSVPSAMPEEQIKDTVYEIVSLLEDGTNDIKKTLMEDILHTMACKRAIKGNTHLNKKEMEALCEKVFTFTSINTCPHGRPIMTSTTRYELEKNFKRIV